MSQPAVIDLGVLGERRDEEPPPERLGPRGSRVARGLLAVVLALLVPGGAAAVDPGLRRVTLAAATDDRVFADGDHAYMLRGPRTAGQRWLEAYALPDLRMLWRVPVTLPNQLSGVVPLDDALLLAVPSRSGDLLIVLDAATGALRWQRDTHGWVWLTHGVIGLYDDESAGVNGPLPGGFDAVRLDTGVRLWSDRVDDDLDTVVGRDAHESGVIVETTARGVVRLRDPATGVIRTQRTLGQPISPEEPGIRLDGDTLLIDDGGGRATAYDVTTLAPRWTATIDLSLMFALGGCGDAICLGGQSGGLRVLDRATGRTRWTSTLWQSGDVVGTGLLVSGGRTGDRIEFGLADPATGRVSLRWFDWQPVLTATETDGVFLTRDGSDGRTFFGYVRPGDGEIRVLGSARGIGTGAGRCWAGVASFHCANSDGSLSVFRVTGPALG